jgi:hypothetical protein
MVGNGDSDRHCILLRHRWPQSRAIVVPVIKSRGSEWVLGSFRLIDGVGQAVWKSGENGSGGSFAELEGECLYPRRAEEGIYATSSNSILKLSWVLESGRD